MFIKNLAGIYSADELFLSLPDHYRLHRVMDPSREGKLERYLNFLAYRIVLVPSETAHYWYLYYSNVKKGVCRVVWPNPCLASIERLCSFGQRSWTLGLC